MGTTGREQEREREIYIIRDREKVEDGQPGEVTE